MPNHCYQTVIVGGPRDVVQYLHRNLSDHDRFCDVVSPMPLRTYLMPEIDESETYGFKATTPAWYNWRLKFWGTKWDVCEVEMIESHSTLFREKEIHGFTFKCWTAWGPPIPIWKKLHNMGVSVHATYQDEGGMFEGEYINGHDRSWEPEFEEEEAC